MTRTQFLGGKVTLYGGDCRDVLHSLPDCSVDSCVTDPPYGLGFMGRAWDAKDGAAFAMDLWAEVLRVLKPGGHVVAFSGTRTYHRMACAIEDAGFDIRDQLAWAYGSGFPKSHDVSKAIDKGAGAQREVVGYRASEGSGVAGRAPRDSSGSHIWSGQLRSKAAATEAARQWEGWGTALKPSFEPICLARKPFRGTVAENVLQHGTGALNIDGCRIEGEPWQAHRATGLAAKKFFSDGVAAEIDKAPHSGGRWPANLCHDGSDEVIACFPETAPARSGKPRAGKNGDGWGMTATGAEYDDNGGSAARFFYTAKADASDRIGTKHPTVKPVDLMQWLVRLTTPKGGTCLDPFAGTGTTGEAAWREGMRCILVEREEEYLADIARRMDLAEKPTKRAAVAKTKGQLRGAEGTPLFGGEVSP